MGTSWYDSEDELPPRSGAVLGLAIAGVLVVFLVAFAVVLVVAA